jgi:hypothetical protein
VNKGGNLRSGNVKNKILIVLQMADADRCRQRIRGCRFSVAGFSASNPPIRLIFQPELRVIHYVSVT